MVDGMTPAPRALGPVTASAMETVVAGMVAPPPRGLVAVGGEEGEGDEAGGEGDLDGGDRTTEMVVLGVEGGLAERGMTKMERVVGGLEGEGGLAEGGTMKMERAVVGVLVEGGLGERGTMKMERAVVGVSEEGGGGEEGGLVGEETMTETKRVVVGLVAEEGVAGAEEGLVEAGGVPKMAMANWISLEMELRSVSGNCPSCHCLLVEMVQGQTHTSLHNPADLDSLHHVSQYSSSDLHLY